MGELLASLIHLVNSIDPNEGGVSSSVLALNEAIIQEGEKSSIHNVSGNLNNYDLSEHFGIIAHGLWQWPSFQALQIHKNTGLPYLVFPHGMLDPWFRKTYPLKHLKKQLYWWFREERILNAASAVCFTTEEERKLARKTFWPYRCLEVVTGLGSMSPPQAARRRAICSNKFPVLNNKKVLLYLGRFHPKKGIDLLINSWIRKSKENEILVMAGPLEDRNIFIHKLMNLSKKANSTILWTGMLNGEEKWSMLELADALILPSHQENFGMVVAEALSVGTPVYLTDKVNIWREVVSTGAVMVASDDQEGIDQLLEEWRRGKHMEMAKHAFSCFDEKLHIKQTARKVIMLLKQFSKPNA